MRVGVWVRGCARVCVCVGGGVCLPACACALSRLRACLRVFAGARECGSAGRGQQRPRPAAPGKGFGSAGRVEGRSICYLLNVFLPSLNQNV